MRKAFLLFIATTFHVKDFTLQRFHLIIREEKIGPMDIHVMIHDLTDVIRIAIRATLSHISLLYSLRRMTNIQT